MEIEGKKVNVNKNNKTVSPEHMEKGKKKSEHNNKIKQCSKDNKMNKAFFG